MLNTFKFTVNRIVIMMLTLFDKGFEGEILMLFTIFTLVSVGSITPKKNTSSV